MWGELTPVEHPRFLVLGAGSRGTTYAEHLARHPEQGQVVAVAEPDPYRRAAFADRHGLPADRVFASWQDALAAPRLADAVTVTTQDSDHVGPALAAAGQGYHILLEKPIAPTEAETRRLVESVQAAGVLLAVCHVLRYTPHTVALRALLDAGAVGEVMSIEHLEPVGWWHAAHSFVRGNWRNETESSPMLLAKSCHDLDWLLAVAGRPCERVASFGSLSHFTRAHQPEGAADRCLECPTHIESACPYSARRIYLGALEQGATDWPLSVITQDVTREGVIRALADGPYGRCVYACDNDVVDHQVVSMEFEGGLTASFTMTAFTTMRGRNTRIFGTHGEITTDSRVITLDDFRTGERRVIDTAVDADEGAAGGHGGGDAGLVTAFTAALRAGDPSLVPSTAEESLRSHLMVFAAERARRTGHVEDVPQH
jgi:predicted dehydrogenase